MRVDSSVPALQPEPGSRRRLLTWLVGAGLLLFALLMWLEPWFFRWLAAQPPCDQLRSMAVAVWVLLALALMPVWVLWRQASRINQAGQFPVSGRWLLRPTPVSRGAAVTTLVLVLRSLAVLLLLAVVAMLAAVALKQPFAAPAHLGCMA